MHRLTAIGLVLVALMGNVVPFALAAGAAPEHACCVRKAARPCHGAAVTEGEQPVVRGVRCCSQNRSGALTAVRGAHPGPAYAGQVSRSARPFFANDFQSLPDSAALGFQSARAPPSVLL